MAYGIDLRKRVVQAHQEGASNRAIAKRFMVDRRTIARWIKREEEGNLQATSPPGMYAALDASGKESLKAMVLEHQDWTLEQYSDGLFERTGIRLKKSAINKYLHALNLRYKKKSVP